MIERRRALTPAEWADRTIERPSTMSSTLECASMENNGVLNIWSGKGALVEVTPENSEAVTALLLQGKIRQEHADALQKVTSGRGDQPTHHALMDLFQQITVYLPPRGVESTAAREEVLRTTEVEFHSDPHYTDVRISRMMRGRPSAILWTIDSDRRLTSSTGPALAMLRDHRNTLGTRPQIESIVPTDSPMYAAHLAALEGKSVKYRSRWVGYEWEGRMQPLRMENRITGAVGYATIYGVAERGIQLPHCMSAPVLTMVTVDGDIIQGNITDLTRLFCQHIAPAAIPHDWLSAIRKIASYGIVDSDRYVNSSIALLTSEEPKSEMYALRDGRTVHRYSHPIPTSKGRMWARSFVSSVAKTDASADGCQCTNRQIVLSRGQ